MHKHDVAEYDWQQGRSFEMKHIGIKLLFCLACTLPLAACVSVPVEKTAKNEAGIANLKKYGAPGFSAPEELKQFGQFAGRWECGMSERRADGSWKVRSSRIIWTWFYTLSGLAVQDLWTPVGSAADKNVTATNLRMFDAASNSWNIAWTNTEQASFELWSGTQQGDELVVTSVRERRPVKIRFFNILPQQFQWSYEAANSLSSDEFTPVLQMTCKRIEG